MRNGVSFCDKLALYACWLPGSTTGKIGAISRNMLGYGEQTKMIFSFIYLIPSYYVHEEASFKYSAL